MGFFEETVVKAKDVFDVAAKKTNEIVEVQKLKINLAKVNSSVSKDFETLGRLAFEKISEGEDIPEEYKPIVESIKESMKQIDDIQSQIDEQKKGKICKECNTVNGETAQYCSNCGNKL